MASSTPARNLASYVASQYTSKNTSDCDREVSEPVEDDWSESSYYEIWVIAQRMRLVNSPQEGGRKMPQQENEDRPENSRPLEIDGGKMESTNTKDAGLFVSLEKGDGDNILDKSFADILLKDRVYFVHFPSIYCYERNRIIFRIGEGPRYHQVTSIVPNPPGLRAPFDIGGISYCFDDYGVLWYSMGELWLPEIIYDELNEALNEVIKCIEENNLHIAADPIYGTSSSTDEPDESTSSGGGSHDTGTSVTEDGLLPISSNPDQGEIDSWMDELKRVRAMQVKEGIRLAPIHCPVSTCGKLQRRPQALRDHLYFHFNIKPHRCDYGCDIAFETEANKNRHLDACPIRWGAH